MRILLVEDEPSLAEVLADAIADQRYVVDVVTESFATTGKYFIITNAKVG